MPERRSPTPAERNTALIQEAAERAVTLALTGSKEATASAVSRALRDQRVDSDLHDHTRRLDLINGSQERTADALGQLAEDSKRHAAVAEALAKHSSEQEDARFSKRTLSLTALGVLAAYLAVLIPLIYLLSQR